MSKVFKTWETQQCYKQTEWNGDFQCDSCKRVVKGITQVNGMDFCAKCYQETFGEREKDQQLAELKQQLKEKDEEIERLKSNTTRINQNIRNSAKKDYESIKLLGEEITLRDDEIKILSERIKELIVRASKSIETNTHQVCEKIRKWCKENLIWDVTLPKPYELGNYVICDRVELREFLEKLEKGEKNENNISKPKV